MRRPSDVLVSTGMTWVPVSDGPKVSITRAMICRDSQTPHAGSEGITAAICRRVRLLTAAAPRERSDPRSSLSIAGVQHRMMTFVNVTIDQWELMRSLTSGIAKCREGSPMPLTFSAAQTVAMNEVYLAFQIKSDNT